MRVTSVCIFFFFVISKKSVKQLAAETSGVSHLFVKWEKKSPIYGKIGSQSIILLMTLKSPPCVCVTLRCEGTLFGVQGKGVLE